VTTCGDFGPIDELPRELSIAEGKLIEADNGFAFELFREINEQEGDKNIFISPLSVAMALGMTYNGAAGSTQVAMQEVLQLQGMSLQEVNESYRSLIDLLRNLDPRVEFIIANSIWYRDTYTFEQEFIDLNRQYFDAEVTPLDFNAPSAAQTMNDWVNEKTYGKIPEIVESPIDPLTIMFLLNAIYFKGTWTHQFDENKTRPSPFLLDNGTEITVDMMIQDEEVDLETAFDDGYRIANISYGGGAYSMTIVLPPAEEGAGPIPSAPTQEDWNAWVNSLYQTAMCLRMPKFRLEYEIGLKDVLSALGMSIAFEPDSANFTKLYSGGGKTWIQSVKHKTFVDVNEEGTEAAAATAVEVRNENAPSCFVVNRPFLFAIREKYSGTILFLGKIVDPTAG
jgi:serine protease inhibitor